MIYSEELDMYITTEDALLLQLEGNKAIQRDINMLNEISI